jgi:azurin
MSSNHASNESSGSFWPVMNTILGVGFGGFALYWGAMLVIGGIKQSQALRAPKAPEPPAAATAAAPAAPAPAAPAAAAAAAPAAAAGAAIEVLIKPDTTNPLMYDTKSFTVKAGALVKLTFDNSSPVPQPHNWILGKPGSKDKLLAASMTMATAPDGMAKGFIPEGNPDMIAHTKLLQPGEKQTIEFTVAAPGEYPFLCSFPGHAILMNGVMKAE